MSAGQHLLDQIERFASHIRERFHQHHEREFIMRFLDDLITKAKELNKAHEDVAAATQRAVKAEADLKALQDQVAADEEKAKAALEELDGQGGFTPSGNVPIA